jgi:hypothetical protein
MKKLILFLTGCVSAQAVFAAAPALTIYNQNFAVVRDSIHLHLKAGVNNVSYNEATMHLEPDSVVLRDPTGNNPLQILEQNFRADPISQALLLNYYEGKTIDFETQPEGAQGKVQIIRGKIIRSGYVPHQESFNEFGQQYQQSQMNYAAPDGGGQPIIEVGGKLRFSLPGQPLFPALSDDSILKPTLTWQLNAAQSGPVDAELSYVTAGMSWQAAYNVVSPENGNTLELVGWVTINNQTGKSFQDAKIKLMAGDVNKIQNNLPMNGFAFAGGGAFDFQGERPPVTEKAFDEYHLYTLDRSTTLLDRETKQIEFVHAEGIQSRSIYIYDGVKIDPNRYNGWNYENIRQDDAYGVESQNKVAVMCEFTNSEANHLGMPLPKGRLRFYRRDADGQMEFTGESDIDHTPRNEVIRVNTGDAFDLVGERTRTNHHLDNGKSELDESFAITVRNHKKEPVEVRIVEHLYRWPTWEISQNSNPFTKLDAQTIDFPVEIKPDGEQTVTYTAHYTW